MTHDGLTCPAFLDAYAEYRDGTMRDPEQRARIEAHLGECLRCRRLAQVMTRGLALLHHTIEEVEPSPHFQARLRERLRAEVVIGDPLVPTHAGLAAAFLLATALGLLVYEGLLRRASAERPVAAVTAPAFEPTFSNVTLPAFTHSTLEFHGAHAPLGSFTLFAR